MTEEHRGEIGRKVFLFLLREGGWWTMSELCAALKVIRDDLHPRLVKAVDAGYIHRRDAERIEFSVKADCLVPGGTSIAELQKAGVAVKIGAAA